MTNLSIKQIFRFQLSLVILLGFALRLYQLDRNSLWFDEIVLTWLASPSFLEGLNRLIGQGIQFAPLDHLVIRIWLLAGEGDWWVRFPSLIFSMLTIPLMTQVGQRMFNRRVGFLAAAIWAVSPYQIWYAQEAKGYALLALAAAGSMYAFVGLLRGERKTSSWQFVIFNMLGISTHYFMFLIPTVQFVIILLNFRKYYRHFRYWVLLQIVSGLVLLPWFGYIIYRQHLATGIGWIPFPTLLDLFYTVWNFTLGYGEVASPAIIAALVVIFITFGWGLVKVNRFRPVNQFVLLWFFLPLVIVWILSQGKLSFYVDRYFQISTPALTLLLAVGLTEIPRQRLKQGLTIAFLLATTFGASQVYWDTTHFSKDDWRSVARILRQRAEPTDGLVTCTDGYRLSLDYYNPGEIFARQSQNQERYYVYPANVDFDIALQQYHRFWLVTSNPRRPQHHLGFSYPPRLDSTKLSAENQAWLVQHPLEVVAVPGITVFLYHMESPPNLNELIRWNCETG